MQYQPLYDAIATRNAAVDRAEEEIERRRGSKLAELSKEENRKWTEGAYQGALFEFERYMSSTPEAAAWAAARMVINAAELDKVEEALECVAQAEISRDKIVNAAIKLLEFEAQFPTSTDIKREQTIVWQALTS